MNSKTFSLLDLNQDCLFEIYHHIPNVFEKIRLKKVCRKLSTSISEYFLYNCVFIIYPFHFGPQKFTTQVPLEKLFSSCPKLAELDTTLFKYSLSDHFHQIDPMLQMTFLAIDGSSSNVSNNRLELLFKKCPNLKRLSLTNFFRTKINYNSLGDYLQELLLYKISFEAFKEILKVKGQKIVIISLDPGNEDINIFLHSISDLCPNLKELIVYSIDSKHIKISLPKLKCLEKLDLFIPTLTIDYTQLTNMFHLMPNLRSLLICICNYIPVQSILDLCSCFCDKIETIQINLTLTKPLNKNELETWKKLKLLKYVNGQTFEYWERVYKNEEAKKI